MNMASQTNPEETISVPDGATGPEFKPFSHHFLPPEVLNPTEEDILDIMTKLAVHTEPTGIHPCYNIEDGRFVKLRGPKLSSAIEEARVMDFIRVHTNIPIPQVRMVFARDGRASYIVMDYVAGTELHSSYRHHSVEELQDIARQLADIIQQIRNIPVIPSSILGSWDGNPFSNTWFRPLLWDSHVTPYGVFQSVEDFNSYWVKRSKLDIVLPRVDHSKIVLSHGDLNSTNIMIKGGKITGIVDWDTFGWYPDFWELIPVRNAARTNPKWVTALDRVFGPQTEISTTYLKMLDAAFEEPLRYELDMSIFGLSSVPQC